LDIYEGYANKEKGESGMNNISDQINSVINNLADKLGVATEKLYPVLIKQAYVDGVTGIVLLILSALLFILSVKTFIKYIQPAIDAADEVNKSVVIFVSSIISVIVTVVVLCVQLSLFGNYITALVNPDWYALQMILDQIK
jgi:hypothetical protein